MINRWKVQSARMRSTICIICIVVNLFSGGSEADAQDLPDTITGKAQVYDGVTFDLIHDGERYRAATRIRLEAVDACELRHKARLAGVDWPCGAVAAAWLASLTLTKDVECRPTRVISGGGFHAQCYVEGTVLAASGLGQGMYVVRVPDREQPPRGYADLEAKTRAARASIWSSEFMTPVDW